MKTNELIAGLMCLAMGLVFGFTLHAVLNTSPKGEITSNPASSSFHLNCEIVNIYYSGTSDYLLVQEVS